MNLHWLDFSVIIVFFAVIFGIAAYYSRKASQGTDQFFLSGRNLPWWLAGTAMVATTLYEYAAGRHGTGGAKRYCGKLALVEYGDRRHADGVLFCPSLETFRNDDRR